LATTVVFLHGSHADSATITESTATNPRYNSDNDNHITTSKVIVEPSIVEGIENGGDIGW
jgi:hypothetical protein